MVRRKPPEILDQVRSWNSMDPVPDNFRKIEVVHAFAVHVAFVIASQPRYPLSHTAFSSLAFVDEGSHDSGPRSGHSSVARGALACSHTSVAVRRGSRCDTIRPPPPIGRIAARAALRMRAP